MKYLQAFAVGALWIIAAGLLTLGIASLFTGCAHQPPPSAIHSIFKPSEQALTSTGHSLDFFIAMSVLAISGAVAIFFLLPTNHKLSLTLGIGGASVFGVSTLLRATLPLIPYLAVGLLIAAVVVGGYEIYIHYIKKAPSATPAK